jgi:asparagine synthase (glutamine-hydrolysing)
MCGIVGGVWTDREGVVSPEILRRSTYLLRHRGPDDEGYFHGPEGQNGVPPEVQVALGHRRLAIIDLVGGKQPLANEDQTVWVVFNGEIYNFRSLRQELEAKGHQFRTRSDTEVLVHLYEELGREMLGRLNGMFAFALWDGRRQGLLLARDRCGEKPLFYWLDRGGLAFASELKALLALPGVPREVDPAAIDLFLTYQYVPHPRTIYRQIRKLPPGHFLWWQKDRLETGPYWNPDFQQEEQDFQPKKAAEELRELLTDAVRLRLESDVPLGAFLSGGIDSTIIVGLMQRLCSQPVHTFSIGFPVAEYDESHYARQAAEFLGTRHHEFRVYPDAVGILPKLIWHYDEPFADSSAIPTWYLAQYTRQEVTVALTGDGGDELFAGYPRYQAVRLAQKVDLLPGPLRRLLTGPLLEVMPQSARFKSPWRRLRRFLEQMGLPPLERYLQWIGIFPTELRNKLYTTQFAEQLATSGARPPGWFLQEAFARADRRDLLTAIMLVDLVTYLPCDLMTKVDIASMAHSLECRQPFLDHRVVEFAARLPLRAKLGWWRGKRLLRQTFRELLPPAIRRRGKMGFGVPLDTWFRGPLLPLLEQVLLGQRLTERGLFRPESIQQLIHEHTRHLRDHSYRLWALLILELWMQQWLDGHLQPLPSVGSLSARSTADG